MAREYDPAVIVHRPGCRHLSLGAGIAVVQPLEKIAVDYPNARPANCLDQGTRTTNGLIEKKKWPEHEYEASTITAFEPRSDGTVAEPPITPLCKTCRGTKGVHVKPAKRERIEVGS